MALYPPLSIISSFKNGAIMSLSFALLSISFSSSCLGIEKPDESKLAILLAAAPRYAVPGAIAGIPNTPFASVSQREETTITEMFEQVEEQIGWKTTDDWARSTQTALEIMQSKPMSNAEMDAYVEATLRGENPERPQFDVMEMIEREKINGEEFASALIGDLDGMSTEDLIQTRIRLTLGLALNQTVAQNNAQENGMPLELLKNNVLILSKARDAVNAELQKRGVTGL